MDGVRHAEVVRLKGRDDEDEGEEGTEAEEYFLDHGVVGWVAVNQAELAVIYKETTNELKTKGHLRQLFGKKLADEQMLRFPRGGVRGISAN